MKKLLLFPILLSMPLAAHPEQSHYLARLKSCMPQTESQKKGAFLGSLAGALPTTGFFLHRLEKHVPGATRRFLAIPVITLLSMQVGVHIQRLQDAQTATPTCTGKKSCHVCKEANNEQGKPNN